MFCIFPLVPVHVSPILSLQWVCLLLTIDIPYNLLSLHLYRVLVTCIHLHRRDHPPLYLTQVRQSRMKNCYLLISSLFYCYWLQDMNLVKCCATPHLRQVSSLHPWVLGIAEVQPCSFNWLYFSFQLEESPVCMSNVEDLVVEQSVVINELRTVANQCKDLLA